MTQKKTHLITIRVDDDDYLKIITEAASLGMKVSTFCKQRLKWSMGNSEVLGENAKKVRELKELEREKMLLRHKEELMIQDNSIAIARQLEEMGASMPHPKSGKKAWEDLHGKVKLLNQVLQLENLYAYCQDERFHDRLSRFEPALADMGLTIPLCLEAVQEIPELVSKRKLTIAPENGGATYKVSMIDTRGSGR